MNDLIKFLDDNGYYFASTLEQALVAQEACEVGILRPLNELIYPEVMDEHYVRGNIRTKNEIPYSLRAGIKSLNQWYPKVGEICEFHTSIQVTLEEKLVFLPFSGLVTIRNIMKARAEIVLLGLCFSVDISMLRQINT